VAQGDSLCYRYIMGATTLGIDLGATKTACAIVDPSGNVLHRVSLPTRPGEGVEGWQERLQEALFVPLREYSPASMGIGVAGQVSKDGVLLKGPNLGWEDIPLQTLLSDQFQFEVAVDNDVRVTALGEWTYGAGRGSDPMLFLSLGTGIGGGWIQGGTLIRGAGNTAGEVGHQIVVTGGRKCTCGGRGCWEAYAGGWGIASGVVRALRRKPVLSPRLAACLKEKGTLEARDIVAAMRRKDPFAVQTLEKAEEYLVSGAVTLVNIMNPARIVLGGGLIGGVPEWVSSIEKGVRRYALNAATRELTITVSSLGADAAVIGAAVLAQLK